MQTGEIIKTRKKRKIYLYLEELNTIQKTQIPVLSKKRKKKMNQMGEIPVLNISVNHNSYKSLDNFIYDTTFTGCKKKVIKYFNEKIRTIKKKVRKING